MPKTKFQDLIFSFIMIIIMVYGMIFYNALTETSTITNTIFLECLKRLPLVAVIVFIIEHFFISKLSKSLTFKVLDPKNTNSFFITILMSSLTVMFMCPIMIFITSLLFNYQGLNNIILNFLTSTIHNFSMAICYQLFYAGPLTRLIFRTIFKSKLS